MLNIPAKDISLRPEFLILLSQIDINPGALITLDDLPQGDALTEKLKPDNVRWILVDHNALQGRLGSIYADQVVGTIDHHDEENKVPQITGNEPRVIEKAGSCTSLVAKYCRLDWESVFSAAISTGAALGQDDSRGLRTDQAFARTWDAQIAKVALASILVDTHNLQSEDKVTNHDTEAVAYLEAKIAASPRINQNFNRDMYFEELSKAKKDIGQLRLNDILRKDYKEWNDEGPTRLGVSSVVKNIDYLASKAQDEKYGTSKSEAFMQAADAFARDRGLGMYSIMTTSTSAKGDFQRELYLSALNTEAVKAAAKFENESREELGLAEWHGEISDVDHSEKDCWRRIWQQRALQHSRKRVAPLLRQALGP